MAKRKTSKIEQPVEIDFRTVLSNYQANNPAFMSIANAIIEQGAGTALLYVQEAMHAVAVYERLKGDRLHREREFETYSRCLGRIIQSDGRLEEECAQLRASVEKLLARIWRILPKE